MKIAIIGAGLQGKRRAQAVSAVKGSSVAVVSDVKLEAAQALALTCGADATTSWEDAISRPEVDWVFLCTPPFLHTPMALRALHYRKHVLCEKPLACSVEEARQMVQAAFDEGVILKCGFNHRHHPGVLQAHKWLTEGKIGMIKYLRCRYGVGGRNGYDQEWRVKPEYSGGGQLMDQGVHCLDLARWFLGEFREGFAYTGTFFWSIAPAEDNAFCLLRTSDERIASIHVSWTQWTPLFSLELFGTDGAITVEGLGGAYGTEKASLSLRDFAAPFKTETIEYRGADTSWALEWQEAAAAAEQGREPLGSGMDGLRSLELAHALYLAAKEGRSVSVGYTESR